MGRVVRGELPAVCIDLLVLHSILLKWPSAALIPLPHPPHSSRTGATISQAACSWPPVLLQQAEELGGHPQAHPSYSSFPVCAQLLTYLTALNVPWKAQAIPDSEDGLGPWPHGPVPRMGRWPLGVGELAVSQNLRARLEHHQRRNVSIRPSPVVRLPCVHAHQESTGTP